MKGKSMPKYTYKTERTLTEGHCENQFYGSLRSDDGKCHVETKMTFVPIKVNRRNNLKQISHIFTGEDPATIKKTGIQRFYTPSHIIFNSEYVERNPKTNPLKAKRYEFEKKVKEQDEINLNKSKNKRNIAQRRIDDNYMHNPMKILNKEETKKYNDDIMLKNQKRTNVYNAILGSNGYSRTLGGIKRPKSENNIRVTSKVTDDSFDITKRSFQINRSKNNGQAVPYYGRKHFVRVSYGDGHFGYL